MMYAPGTVLRMGEPHMDRVLPPVTSFVDPVQSPSYRGLLEGQMEGPMESDVSGVERRMRDMDTRTIENRNFEWTQDDNQRYHQNYFSNSSPGSGHWPDVVPNEVQPSLQGQGVIPSHGYPLTYGVNDSHWDYQRTANNELLLTNTGLSANVDNHPSALPRAPPDVSIPPPRALPGRAPVTRRSRGHRGGRQREKTPPFESDQERRQWMKERRKKDIHNKIEQRRRYNINDRIDDLGSLLRKGGHDIRHNKGAILRETIVYIRALRDYLAGLEKVEERAEELNRTNETILLRIQRMQSFLQSRGYSPSNDLCSRPAAPSVDHQEWTSLDQLPVYPNVMRETPQRGNAVSAPYPEAPLVKQESPGSLTPLYAPSGATMAGAGGGGGEGLPSGCENPSTGYYQMQGQYQF